jgi:hypothetical protein
MPRSGLQARGAWKERLEQRCRADPSAPQINGIVRIETGVGHHEQTEPVSLEFLRPAEGTRQAELGADPEHGGDPSWSAYRSDTR